MLQNIFLLSWSNKLECFLVVIIFDLGYYLTELAQQINKGRLSQIVDYTDRNVKVTNTLAYLSGMFMTKI
jgi:hypothetical protein